MRYRVTVRSHNYVSADVEVPDGADASEGALRDTVFDLIESGAVDWETDYAEVEILNLGPRQALTAPGAVD